MNDDGEGDAELTYYQLEEQDLVELLIRASHGEDIDIIVMELYVNSGDADVADVADVDAHLAEDDEDYG